MTRQIPIHPFDTFCRRLWYAWKDLDRLTRWLVILGIVMWAALLVVTVVPVFGETPCAATARSAVSASFHRAEEPRGGAAPSPLRRSGAEVVRCRFRVTAYCPCAKCCGQFADGRTATGARANHPLVAAPPCIPFGTRMHVPGYAADEWVTVEDRGGAIQGARLDVLFPTHRDALRWGVRDLWVEVEVPKEVSDELVERGDRSDQRPSALVRGPVPVGWSHSRDGARDLRTTTADGE